MCVFTNDNGKNSWHKSIFQRNNCFHRTNVCPNIPSRIVQPILVNAPKRNSKQCKKYPIPWLTGNNIFYRITQKKSKHENKIPRCSLINLRSLRQPSSHFWSSTNSCDSVHADSRVWGLVLKVGGVRLVPGFFNRTVKYGHIHGDLGEHTKCLKWIYMENLWPFFKFVP